MTAEVSQVCKVWLDCTYEAFIVIMLLVICVIACCNRVVESGINSFVHTEDSLVTWFLIIAFDYVALGDYFLICKYVMV